MMGAIDGILGLALPKMSTTGARNAFDNMRDQGLLAAPQFSVYLSRSERDNASEFVIGGADAAYHTEPLRFVPIISDIYWEVELAAVVVGGHALNLCGAPRCRQRLVVDTGTSLITGPPAPLEQLKRMLGVAHSCGNFGELPELTFVLGAGLNAR